MKILFKKSHIAVAAFSALLVTACGVGGGLAGIGGSGYISTGTVTSFGSVFVNGVEFETNASTYEIEDDSSLTQADLRIGMVVEVSGSINADGITGNATHIKYADDLEGSVTNLMFSANTAYFSILGNAVSVSEASTTFEDTTFATIANGNVLEVSGFYDQNNVLNASYIEFKSASANANTVFEIKGQISNLNVNDFEIKGVAVNGATAIFEGLPNGLQNGLFVEAKGTFTNNVLVASSIEREDGFSDNASVELEGIITRYVGDSDFDINGQVIDASNAIFSPASLTLELGIKVEANGQLTNGVFIASEIEAREGSAAVSATVSVISANSFTVKVLEGQLVTVQLTSATLLKDEIGDDGILQISELNTGDFVSVIGFEIESTSDTITATEVKRESETKETILQGVVTAESANDFTVLGVTYPVSVSTIYDGADNNAAFMALTELGITIVSIIDATPSDGVADEVGFED